MSPSGPRHPEERHRSGPRVFRAPLAASRLYQRGEILAWEVIAFGDAIDSLWLLWNGLVRAVRCGLGQGHTGTFELAEVWAEAPFGGARQPVYRALDETLIVPDLPIRSLPVQAEADALIRARGAACVRLAFLTPLRLPID